ncbi:diguanylate cyclase [Massilia agilis]|uniref:Diguanylate cyclase n=1 Tax=Massilia agilis TaxID=1811226 RepID=A0ABT2D6A7_9BURK|nr:diguanylate cyclase [Massilia agilis]MCS0806842.1 diguanylate cyclase [Massilia agilis]
MSKASAQWAERYLSAVHWFIPAQLHGAAVPFGRAQNVVNAALVAAMSGPFYALAYHLLGFDAAAAEILACCLLMLGAPLVLRTTGSIVAARETFLCGVFFNFSWLTWHLGGIGAPTASWLITAPVVAMFLGGARTALFWLAMSCAAAGLAYLLPALGTPLPPHPVSEMGLLYLICDLGLYLVVVVFVLLFELTKNQGFEKLEQALALIKELAIRDELTGAHNRRRVLELIASEKERSDRNGRGFCLCLLDIDFFKRINDTYGHAAGDTVLREFARTVQSMVRGTDTFGRYGGEEFMLMLPETRAEDALMLAERVRGAVERMRAIDGASEIAVTVSIGVTEYRAGEEVGQAVARADEALYMAKSTGRNRVVRHGSDCTVMQPGGPARQSKANQHDMGLTVARLIDSAQYDQLTGLLNRRLLRDRLRHAMERADRNRHTVALILMDINNFKEVNDALGYEAGDAVLAQAGATIRGCLRDSDSVARWGGDEFVALLEDLAVESDAQAVADKILARFAQPFRTGAHECLITMSVGIALYPAADCDLDALLKRADIAVRLARRWGENSVRVYSADASEPQSERLALKTGMREALREGQLFIEYQPQVELASRRIVGVEALLRWQHPVYGRIAPDRFIPLAEETGLIVQIGEWVLRTACAQNRAWREAGLPEVRTAVNLSARQLKDPDIVARVLQIVADSGVPTRCVEIEITEGTLIEDLAVNRVLMNELRQAGVLVSIDDFGAGYSSLNYLSELPVDILKMDGMFVRRLGATSGRARSFALAESIVDMAHRLQLKVIAEAVETGEQLADLCAMRCDAAQGYLFARPLPPDQLGALLARQYAVPAAPALA